MTRHLVLFFQFGVKLDMMQEDIPPVADKHIGQIARYPEARVESIARRTLLNRWGNPEDVAEAVLYFVRAEYVTGEVLFVDGGERFGHRKPGGA